MQQARQLWRQLGRKELRLRWRLDAHWDCNEKHQSMFKTISQYCLQSFESLNVFGSTPESLFYNFLGVLLLI